ncbi:MAG: ECF transporter S component [Defluviitaleaceae bacterium]|nr:ECF transporter S component [Defluviitaleaceae bacterium]
MSNLRKLVVTAMLIALCVVLPMAFHAIPRAGSIILPMHIPVLLAGLICGWKFGLIAGVAGPFLSSVLTGMPPMGVANLMMIELGVYGLVAGLLAHWVHTKIASLDLYISLIGAMLVGRVVAGIAQAMYFFGGALFAGRYTDGVYATYTLALWTASYFVTSLPGIVIQLAFIPSVVLALERERVIPLRYPMKSMS